MATPPFTVQNLNLNLQSSSPQLITVQCNDLSNTPVDISSGYDALLILQSQSTSVKGAAIYVANTPTYGSTGLLTFALTEAQSKAIPCSETMVANVFLSNDSNVTTSPVAVGSLRMSQSLA